jgi:uncharacterized protein (TIGR00661 family)
MKRCSIIIQGEGRGHFSQAMAAMELLKKSDIEVARVYIGKSFFRKTPAYFYSSLKTPVLSFYSPNFLRSPDRKGIRVLFSILLNLVLSPVYIYESIRLGILMISDKSKLVLNFYDPIGSLACRYWKRRANRIAISHHFYLSHPDFYHPHGFGNSYLWLGIMNRMMIRSADKVLALSFREGKSLNKIEVIPPFIRHQIKTSIQQSGERDLCYFLNPGFDLEMLEFYRQRPGQKADIFTDATLHKDIPENVGIHKTSRENFQSAMASCKRIITTAGFDTVAEAFYLEIPIYLIPSTNHYEQYCNALDATRTGLGFQLESLSDLSEVDFQAGSNQSYKKWADKIEEFFLKGIQDEAV